MLREEREDKVERKNKTNTKKFIFNRFNTGIFRERERGEKEKKNV